MSGKDGSLTQMRAVWQREMLLYFVQRDYLMVYMPPEESGIVLFNPASSSFALVILSLEDYAKSPFLEEKYDGYQASVERGTGKKMKRLELYCGSAGHEEIFEEGRREAVLPGWKAPEDLKGYFPGIDEVLAPIVGEARSQISALNARINRIYRENLEKLKDRKEFSRFVRAASGGREKKKKGISLTHLFMGICAAVYVLSLLLAGMTDSSASIAVVLGGYYKAFVLGMGEYWRFVTTGFVHTELWHFVSNMISLYYIGTAVEALYGRGRHPRLRVLAIFLGSILSSSLFVMAVQGNGITIGISGMLFGCTAAVMVWLTANQVWNRQNKSLFLRIIVLNVIVSLMPGVSWQGHLGGFIGGMAVSFFLTESPQWQKYRRAYLAAIAAFYGILLWVIVKTPLDAAYYGTDLDVAAIWEKLGFSGYADRIRTVMKAYYELHSLGL